MVWGAMGAHVSAEDRLMGKRRSGASACNLRFWITLLFLPLTCLFALSGIGLAQEGLKLAYEKAQQLFDRGDHAQAATAFRILLAQTYRARAGIFQAEGLWKEAADDLTAALGLGTGLDTTRFDLAYVDFCLQRYGEAASLLEQLARSSPDDPRIHALLGKAYFSLKKNGAAHRELQIASRLDPGDHSTANALTPAPPAPLTETQKKLLSIYGQVLVNGHNYLARIAVSEGKFGEAAQQFAQVGKLQPDYPEVDYRQGLALFKADQFAQAEKPLENALARNPIDAPTQKYLGLTYFELGKYDDAIKLLRQARSSLVDDPEVLLALGGALARTHHDQDAQQVFADLMKSHPDSAGVHILLGKAYAAQGQMPQAEQEFRRALELSPEAPTAHLYLGLLKMQEGQMGEAGKEFKSELQVNPADVEARYNLAFVLLKQQKAAEAVPLLRQVIREKPAYAEAHYSLGKTLLEQGDTEEAISELRKAVQLDPQKAYSHYQLGRAYMLVGQRGEAQKEFELTRNLKDQQLKFQNTQPGKTP
ncbi:MAG: tetratricopeptide repeat protein [Acidobacteria bacterium]|nr:MAG: tetratricopeptide repeat protein [Acidobacteriota bacterium]